MFLKKVGKVHRKTTVLESILVKMQASSLRSETLIKKETTSQMFSCEFCKTFNKIFVHFSPTFVTFQRINKLNKIGK